MHATPNVGSPMSSPGRRTRRQAKLSHQHGEPSPPSSSGKSKSLPIEGTPDKVIEEEIYTEKIYETVSTSPEEDIDTMPTIITEERTILSRAVPFFSKQRSQWWLPLALALSFALILLILRTTMVDTPMLSPGSSSLSDWFLGPSTQHMHNHHHLARTARRHDTSPQQLDEIVRQMEEDVRDIKRSVEQALSKEHAYHHHQPDRSAKEENVESKADQARSKAEHTIEKGKEALDFATDKYEGGKMYVRDKIYHTPEDVAAMKDRYTLDHGEMHLRDKIRHIREEIDSFRGRHFRSHAPTLYERVMGWLGGTPASQQNILLTSEPHPYLEPQYLDSFHYSREGQLRREMENKVREAKQLLREQHKGAEGNKLWNSVKHIFHHPDELMSSEDLALLRDNDSLDIISPKLREMLSKQSDSPHAQALLKELEELESKGKTYATDAKGHFSRIRDAGNSIIHQALSTLEAAKEKIVSGKDEMMSKLTPSTAEEEPRPMSYAAEHVALLEESIRHVYALAREQAEHQARMMGEYGRHSASSMSEWLRHEKEKAHIQAMASDKDMSDRHHDAPGLLFDPLSV